MSGTVRYCTSVDGVRIAYSVEGEGPPLLFSHHVYALSLSHLLPSYHDFLQQIGRGRQLIRYDLRGCGLSQRAVDDLSPAAMVADLDAVVQALALDQFGLLGAAAGGPRAIEYAAHYPARVSHLVLYETFARVPDVFPGPVLDSFAQLARSNWGLATRTFVDSSVRRTEEGLLWANVLERSIDGETMARMIEANLNMDVSNFLTRIQCPALVCHAVTDSYVPFHLGKHLAELIPGARLVPLEGEPAATFANAQSAIAAIDEFLPRSPLPDATPVAESRLHTSRQLTKRETEVLRLIAAGCSSSEISRELSLSIRTVGRHITNIYAKIGAHGRADATAYAVRHGLTND